MQEMMCTLWLNKPLKFIISHTLAEKKSVSKVGVTTRPGKYRTIA
jgi:hypothetical protein